MTVIASELDVLTSNDIDLELRVSDLEAPAARKEWMFEASRVWQCEAKKEWILEDSKTWQVAAWRQIFGQFPGLGRKLWRARWCPPGFPPGWQ